MTAIVAFVLGLALGTALLKGSIRIVDGFNYKNTWAAAFGWNLLFSVVGLVPGAGLFGILFLLAYLMILFRYYELGILQTLGVVVVQVVLSVAVTAAAAALLGGGAAAAGALGG